MVEVIGIDPGTHGAIASYDGGDFIKVFDFPTLKSATRGEEMNVPVTVEMILEHFPNATHGYIEQVQARPGEGRGTIFKFGYSAGVARGILCARRIPVFLVTSQKWKAAMRCTADKDYSRTRATQEFPMQASEFVRKKDMNKAEAALIALYGYRVVTGVIK